MHHFVKEMCRHLHILLQNGAFWFWCIVGDVQQVYWACVYAAINVPKQISMIHFTNPLKADHMATSIQNAAIPFAYFTGPSHKSHIILYK